MSGTWLLELIDEGVTKEINCWMRIDSSLMTSSSVFSLDVRPCATWRTSGLVVAWWAWCLVSSERHGSLSSSCESLCWSLCFDSKYSAPRVVDSVVSMKQAKTGVPSREIWCKTSSIAQRTNVSVISHLDVKTWPDYHENCIKWSQKIKVIQRWQPIPAKQTEADRHSPQLEVYKYHNATNVTYSYNCGYVWLWK